MKHPWHDPDCPHCNELFKEDELNSASHHLCELLDEDRVDEAEAAAHALLKNYPEEIDGLAGLALVYETKGKMAEALQYYEATLAFALCHEGFLPEFFRVLRARIAEVKGALPCNGHLRN